MVDRPRLGISRCLLGEEVRYDGGHKRDAVLLDALGPLVEWVPVCPEVETGMGTPREPIHLIMADDGVASAGFRVRLVGVSSGVDWTASVDRWRRQRVRELSQTGVCGFILKAKSPSCGVRSVPLAAADAEARVGRGLFAQVLLDEMPDLPVEDDDRLHDERTRAEFLERVFAYHRRSCLAKDS